MKIYAKKLSLIFIFLVLSWQQAVAETSLLRQVSTTSTTGNLQIFLRLSALPEATVDTQGKRVDLVLADTIAATSFKPLAGDDKMIKMISRKQSNGLLLSFYFRYPPQHVQLKKMEETRSIMLNIQLGNPLSARYPDLSSRLHGVTLLHRQEIDFTNPIYGSTYGTDWKLFIRRYESPVSIRPRFLLTMPPFPMAAAILPKVSVPDWLGEKNVLLSRQKAWLQIADNIKNQLENEGNESYRKRLLLTYGECLVRAGKYEEPYKLLQQIALTYPDSPLAVYGDILFVYVIARHEDPYIAAINIKKYISEKYLDSNNPLLPRLNIFAAELSMETGRVKEAEKILSRDDIAYPRDADLLRLLRQADTYYLSADSIKALVAYDKIDKRATVIDSHPRSLAQFCDTLYTHQRYADAVKKYQVLVKLLSGDELQPTAMFRLAASRLKNGEKWIKTIPLLTQIQTAFPGSVGDYRAGIKLTDIKFLRKIMTPEQAASSYGQIGMQANRKQLREEALVKEAMVDALAGKRETSITLAMKILRDFRHGLLTTETKALIISQLPSVIKEMIKKGKYVDALVLAKQNRRFFARGWLETELLFDLAHAYEQLGAYDRAGRVYQYILDVATGREQEKAYVPMIKALYNTGRFDLVEDYGNQYFSRFPNSPARAEVYLLRVKALEKAGDTKAALRLLEEAHRPTNPDIEKTAARLFFNQGRWQKVITLLTDKKRLSWTGAERDYLLAESLFQAKQFAKAIPVFSRLTQEDPYEDQAMFRLAEIYEKTGKREKALNRFRQLTEKGKDARWKKLAEEEIKIMQLGINNSPADDQKK